MGKTEREKGARFEREIAAALRTERAGTKGRPDGDDADVRHPAFYVRCKRRARLAVHVAQTGRAEDGPAGLSMAGSGVAWRPGALYGMDGRWRCRRRRGLICRQSATRRA